MRVSVAVPAYNAEKTIAQTLESLRAQTYADYEVIVIDDGSIDRTAAIVAGFQADDPRIRMIHQKNAGLPAVRQRALMEARGEFLAMLDADDIWHPTKLEKQVAAFATAPEDVAAVYCWSRYIDDRGLVIATLPAVRAEGFILCQHVYDNVIGNGSCLMMRVAMAREVGGFRDERRGTDVQSADDHLLQLRLAARYRFALVPEYLVGYRQGSATMSRNKNRLHASIMANLQITRNLCDRVPARAYQWSRAASLYDGLAFKVRKRHFAAALAAAAEAFILDPLMFLDRVRLTVLRSAARTLSTPAVAFSDIDPAAAIVEDDGLHARRMRQLSAVDSDIFNLSREVSAAKVKGVYAIQNATLAG